MKIAIVGAGIAGLSCADVLVAAGCTVRMFDKGRGPGGRMSTRRLPTRLGDAFFDHGAQYFTVRDADFRAKVAQWSARGLAAPWPEGRLDAWVGLPGMNSVVKEMASQHDVHFSHLVKGLARDDQGWTVILDQKTEGRFDAVVLAVPAEQAAPILALHDFEMAQAALLAPSQPCWTGMFAFEGALPTHIHIVRDTGNISWAANNRLKAGRVGPASWVVQASASWSSIHLEQDAVWVEAQLLDALTDALSIPMPTPIASAAHRWRFALSAGTGQGALWNEALHLGACGDWLVGPRVECAWLSGRDLGMTILDSQGLLSAERRGFDTEGYRFKPYESDADRWRFTRA